MELINKSGRRPDFVLFTGDLIHDTGRHDVHAHRMQLFKSIARRINTAAIHIVPGENDAALYGGVLYRGHFGKSYYSFDHKGVHFIALDNVSRGRLDVGPDQLAWLKPILDAIPKLRRSWFLLIDRLSTSSLNGNRSLPMATTL